MGSLLKELKILLLLAVLVGTGFILSLYLLISLEISSKSRTVGKELKLSTFWGIITFAFLVTPWNEGFVAYYLKKSEWPGLVEVVLLKEHWPIL